MERIIKAIGWILVVGLVLGAISGSIWLAAYMGFKPLQSVWNNYLAPVAHAASQGMGAVGLPSTSADYRKRQKQAERVAEDAQQEANKNETLAHYMSLAEAELATTDNGVPIGKLVIAIRNTDGSLVDEDITFFWKKGISDPYQKQTFAPKIFPSIDVTRNNYRFFVKAKKKSGEETRRIEVEYKFSRADGMERQEYELRF